MPAPLEALEFAALTSWSDDDHLAAFRVFQRSAHALLAGNSTRAAQSPSIGLVDTARAAISAHIEDTAAARRFFETRFCPVRVLPESSSGFLTGYYEPCIAASRVETSEFRWPVLARPADLISFAPSEAPAGFPDGVSGAIRRADGSLAPYPDRAEIETERRDPLVWLRDSVEAFLIHVQGSAQVEFPDGRRARLAYDGRNGLPYTSIGRTLIDAGEIAESAMSVASLKAWLRGAGAGEGGKGLALMRRNRSYVFFRLIEDFDSQSGPIAGAGVALTPLRSIAIDRSVWAYGLPFWIEADLPWDNDAATPFHRLMIAQDTGSAIVGPARADIFFGSGDAAGARAGAIRHRGAFAVLLPAGDEA